ncbi:MAG: HAD-IIIA family hydrolase [Lachnospiraceae bacterium]|nr:HAD-IIIA family hydrolase [Lachnospiraceae bacterium]
MIDTIIFDLDGTLLNTLEDLTDSVNYVMREYGLPIHTIEEIKSYVGNGAAKLIERAVPQGTGNPAYEKMLKMFREHYALHCEDKAAPYEGVMELLASLHQAGYRMAIVSNKPDRSVKQLYRKYFKEYVQEAVGESESEGIKRKPAPDMVYQALARLSSDMSYAVYVGDSEVDIMTAANVPMTCISVTWGFRTKEQLLAAGAKEERMIMLPQKLQPLLANLGQAE